MEFIRFGIVAAAFAVALAGSWTAPAQDGPAAPIPIEDRQNRVTPPGGQVPPRPAEDPLRIDQIGASVSSVSGSGQIAPRFAGVQPVLQLNPSRGDATPAAQLYRGRPSANAPLGASQPADGRRQAVVRLGGRDRCDPQAAANASRACANVIENRADEYSRPVAPTLSPEQRLLIDQRLREGWGGTRSAVERIGRNDIDPGSRDTQGIASIALQPPPAARVEAAQGDPTMTPGSSAVSGAIIEAIVERGQSGAPR